MFSFEYGFETCRIASGSAKFAVVTKLIRQWAAFPKIDLWKPYQKIHMFEISSTLI
jgi:hypothetical protein